MKVQATPKHNQSWDLLLLWRLEVSLGGAAVLDNSSYPILFPRVCLFNQDPLTLLSTVWHSLVLELHLCSWHWASLPVASRAGEITITIVYKHRSRFSVLLVGHQDPVDLNQLKTHTNKTTKDRQGCTMSLPLSSTQQACNPAAAASGSSLQVIRHETKCKLIRRLTLLPIFC